MKYFSAFILILFLGCSPEEEPSLLNGIWKAEEETNFYFYEYTFDLQQLGDSIAVTGQQIIATYRDPTEISWTYVNGSIEGNKIHLRFKDGGGYVSFQGVLLGSTLISSKYYGYVYGGEYEETLRGEVTFYREK